MKMWFSISLPVPGSQKAFPAHPCDDQGENPWREQRGKLESSVVQQRGNCQWLWRGDKKQKYRIGLNGGSGWRGLKGSKRQNIANCWLKVYALQVILFEECCDSLVFYGFQLQQAVALGGLESGGTDERTSEGGIVRKILRSHVCRRCGQPSGALGGRRGRVWLEEPLLCGISQVKGLSYVQ